MKDTVFFVLKGNNGATYICNVKSWATLNHSLKFYKARTSRAKFLKFGLQVLLFVKGKLRLQALKTSNTVETYIQTIVKNKVGFNIDTRCSILISPTNDKVIVNHHNEYFQKFAFGKSYNNVKKESKIYNLFNKPIENFQISTYCDTHDTMDEMISFKLYNKHISNATGALTKEDLVPVLLEFFIISNQRNVTVKEYASSLQSKLQQSQHLQIESLLLTLEKIKTEFGELEFPLGLVHRDFKPWNIMSYSKPLIFDFEETIMDGIPLEDLLNFNIDPIIRYKTFEEILGLSLNVSKVIIYKNYLRKLNIGVNFDVFLHFYLMERFVFYSEINNIELSNKYLDLSTYLNDKKWV